MWSYTYFMNSVENHCADMCIIHKNHQKPQKKKNLKKKMLEAVTQMVITKSWFYADLLMFLINPTFSVNCQTCDHAKLPMSRYHIISSISEEEKKSYMRRNYWIHRISMETHSTCMSIELEYLVHFLIMHFYNFNSTTITIHIQNTDRKKQQLTVTYKNSMISASTQKNFWFHTKFHA